MGIEKVQYSDRSVRASELLSPLCVGPAKTVSKIRQCRPVIGFAAWAFSVSCGAMADAYREAGSMIVPGTSEPSIVPPAYEVFNDAGRADILLVCDHASNALPAAYGTLGLDPEILSRHIAYDIGAADVTRRISRALDAPAVMAGYSRLLIDCNRQPGHTTSIPEISDGIEVPLNHGIDAKEVERRQRAYFQPFHAAVEAALQRFSARGVVPAYVAMHSFTPIMAGYERPWHVGILWNEDTRLAQPLIDTLSEWPEIVVGENQPYSGRDPEGYSIHTHGGDRGIPNVLIEVRQDLVDTHHGAEIWAARIGQAISKVVKQGAPFKIECT